MNDPAKKADLKTAPTSALLCAKAFVEKRIKSSFENIDC